jgi:hypothetical protein
MVMEILQHIAELPPLAKAGLALFLAALLPLACWFGAAIGTAWEVKRGDDDDQ